MSPTPNSKYKSGRPGHADVRGTCRYARMSEQALITVLRTEFVGRCIRCGA